MALAYSSLVIMAMLPIFFGSKRSVHHQKEQKVIGRLRQQYWRENLVNFFLLHFQESDEKPDIMTKKVGRAIVKYVYTKLLLLGRYDVSYYCFLCPFWTLHFLQNFLQRVHQFIADWLLFCPWNTSAFPLNGSCHKQAGPIVNSVHSIPH